MCLLRFELDAIPLRKSDLQDGSDGTRTRDLRRDRPGTGKRRQTKLDDERPAIAQGIWACGHLS